jgi:hypothetical protein
VRIASAFVIAVALLAGSGAEARAAGDRPPPAIDLYTMGPGREVFQMFGHAAICVEEADDPRGLCYNYGTTDFTSASKVVWDFLRNRAKFWVSVTTRARMEEFYTDLDRTLYVQRLPLTPEQARTLADRLAEDVRDPAKRYYTYHHFFDNCTTRIRDHVDAVTGGRMRDGAGVRFGPTYRDITRKGFAANAALLVGNELLIGRSGEDHPTVWDAMFLPDVLREEVQTRFGVEPRVVNRQQGTLPRVDEGSGRTTLLLFSVILAALTGAGVLSRRCVPRRIALVTAGLILGLLGLGLEVFAVVSTHSELTKNELLGVFVSTDLALVVLNGRWLRWYVTARLGLLVLVMLGAAFGLLIQPLWIPLVFVVLPIGVIVAAEWVAVRRTAVLKDKQPDALVSSPARD